jgi:hypothetical protein
LKNGHEQWLLIHIEIQESFLTGVIFQNNRSL